MKLAVIIDPIETLNPKKDSTIAMLRAAHTKGLSLYITSQKALYVRDARPFATLTPLTITTHKTNWYELGIEESLPLSELDIIVMRKDPPFDMNYIYTTYLLELAEKAGVLVANKPQGLRDANEKYFTNHFPKLSPPTLISQSYTELKAFYHEYNNVIFKPLDGMGGRGIFHIDEQGQNLNVCLEILTDNERTPIMAQRYIPEIKTGGDKRVLIIGDTIVPFALARIPEGDDPRGNLAKGASAEVIKLSPSDKKKAMALLPALKERGLYFVGIDIIGDYITEINVTSPTGIQEIEQHTDFDVSGLLIDTLIKHQQML
jgi:glutathione synthase